MRYRDGDRQREQVRDCTFLYIYIYIYMYIERERERECDLSHILSFALRHSKFVFP